MNQKWNTQPLTSGSVVINTGLGGPVTVSPMSSCTPAPTFTTSGTAINQGTITVSGSANSSPTVYAGMTGNNKWNTLMDPPAINIGEHELSEETVGDLLIMLEVVKNLDDSNPVKDMFNTIKMLNKIKGKK